MQNAAFRRAVAFATDRKTYNAQTVGDELALTSLINSYTPGTFVYLEEDVTIDINGTATTFAAGTYYGANDLVAGLYELAAGYNVYEYVMVLDGVTYYNFEFDYPVMT